ncbi:MAG: hypothetical protein JKX74_07650 [Flavobacteriales bacterium]|nr:hypothetical protein [Flavobacteriales bacterium]
MKRLKKTGLGLLIIATISGCSSFEAKYCATDGKDQAPTTNTSLNDESISMPQVNNINMGDMGVNFNSEEPLVCLLTGPELVERKDALKEEIFSQVKKTEEMKTGYLFYFKYDESFLMKMTDYILAENNCCPFLTFDIKLHSKDDVMLKITGPSEEAKRMIEMALIDDF